MRKTKGDYSFYNILMKIREGKYEQSELNCFIEKLIKIGESYIRYSYTRIKKILISYENSSRDIALEAISQLFLNANYNNHFIIVDVIKNWDPQIESEEEAVFFLNKIIGNRIEQHISLKLRESDPLFSKLLDSVNYLIRTENYNKINYLGKVYITESDNKKIDWIVIDDHEFHKIPAYLFFERKVLLSSLFKYIKTETTFFSAIPLNELIFRLKHIYQSDYSHNNFTEDVAERFEVKETVNSGLNFVEDKLKTTYYEKSKLTNTEYISFKKALTLLATDLGNGGLSTNLYSYLHPYFNDLSKEVYHQNYHNKFEYLVKLFKNKVAEQLNENKNIYYTIIQMVIYNLILEYDFTDMLLIFSQAMELG